MTSTTNQLTFESRFGRPDDPVRSITCDNVILRAPNINSQQGAGGGRQHSVGSQHMKIKGLPQDWDRTVQWTHVLHDGVWLTIQDPQRFAGPDVELVVKTGKPSL